ncbi:hypothetical protein BH11PLA1_BH11PLA1_09950 [soil metagenome]
MNICKTVPALALLVALSGCASSQKGTYASNEMVIPVEGMKCTNCAKDVEKHLAAVRGVRDAAVSLHDKQAVVTVDPAMPPSRAALEGAVAEWRTGHESGKDDPNCLNPSAKKKG